MELTEAILDKLCSYVCLGASPDTAARAEGISESDLKEWFLKAQKVKDGIYSKLIPRLDQASAQGEILHIQRIVFMGGAKESQWMLERMYPGKWATKSATPQKKQISAAIDAAFSEKPKRKQIEKK